MNETKTPLKEYVDIDKEFWDQVKKDITEINDK